MAHSEIVLKHPESDHFVTTPVGFSWTTLFFGFLPAIMRGDYRWAGIQFGLLIPLAILAQGPGFLAAVLFFGWLYNRLYIRQLVRSGYVVSAWNSRRSIDQLAAELGMELPLLPEAAPIGLVAE